MDDNNVIGILIVVMIVLLVGIVGVVVLSFYFSSNSAVVVANQVPAASSREMVATIKGSIYGSGEIISVFGTCMDTRDIPVVNATAKFSAWYPNGTQFVFSEAMINISDGYFLYTGIMSVVHGTYLTEVICNASIGGFNQIAKAWGEWQNPYWVEDIQNISNDMLSNISMLINYTVSNITFLQENMSNNFNYTNQLILDTQLIANASVDRNSSYLAQLLLLLMGGTSTPLTGFLNVTEDYHQPYINRWWKDKVTVYNEYGNIVSSPDITCYINTTDHGVNYMDPEGNHFTIALYITSWTLSWNVTCYYL